ncbi:MAG: DUF2490 domain-containing protein [Bacteroidota bacterium]
MQPYNHTISFSPKYLIPAICCLILTSNSFAQETNFQPVSDAELWSSVIINKKITSKLNGSFEEQLRLNDNISSVKNFFSDIGLSYMFNKYIRLATNYRYIQRRRDDRTYGTRHRFYGDLRFRFKTKPFIFYYRTRLQTQQSITGSGIIRDNYSRNSLTLKLDLDKKIAPYIATELYYYLNCQEFNKVRYTLGIDLNLKKRNDVGIFYRIQREFNVNNPIHSYIIGINYSYTLKGRIFK